MPVRKFALTGLLAAAAVPGRLAAQVDVTPGTPYTQDFRTLPNNNTSSGGAVSSSWTNNTTLAGWYATKQSNGTAVSSIVTNNGSSATGGLYGFKANGTVASQVPSSLGTIATDATGNMAFGLALRNAGTSAVTVQLKYQGEQWRANSTAAQRLDFSYAVSSAAVTNLDAGSATPAGFTNLDAFDFVSLVNSTIGPVSPTATGARPEIGGDTGNAADLGTLLSGVTVGAGEYLTLRWFGTNNGAGSHGLGVDNLTVRFTPVPEPAGLFAAAGLALAGWRLRRRLR